MRAVRVMSLVLSLGVVAVVGFWAGRTALEPPADPIDAAGEAVVYAVSVDTVGRSFSFTAIGEWELVPAGRTGGGGTVTGIEVAGGDTVSPGDVLFTVDLRPVVVAEGEVPMFRDLALEATGEDVVQLQAMLAALGFYEGEADGTFGPSTRAAVRRWQDSLGIDNNGIVRAGDVMFLPSLPARVALAESVVPGARLGAGEVVVSQVPEAPNFYIPLAPEQASLVPLTADVEITYLEGVWEGRVERAVETDSGELRLWVTAPNGGALCDDECARWVDLSAPTSFEAEVIVLPETTGVAVPVAGIATDPGNNSFVTLADGSMVEVLVVASVDGLSIVEGIDEGTEILLPAD